MGEEVKYCAWTGCDKLLARKPGETAQNWRNRRYCGKRCAALHQASLRKARNGVIEECRFGEEL